ncbi:DUF6290 family protein [uncultured Ruminococcus sp.]|nr:DUF6290 family protein [uncultured Ruminococcus sp.]
MCVPAFCSAYADMHGVTVSEFMKQSVLERIED